MQHRTQVSAHLFDIYQHIMACGCPNFAMARIQLLFKFCFQECDKLADSHDNAQTVEFLWFSFPAGYEGQCLHQQLQIIPQQPHISWTWQFTLPRNYLMVLCWVLPTTCTLHHGAK